MPKTIEQGFDDFHTKLTPNLTESKELIAFRKSLNDCLVTNFGMTNFFRTGSTGNGTILKTIDGGKNWYKTVSTNTFPSDFFRITFVNKNIGFASREYGTLFRTLDGGETWTVISEYSDAAYTIQFINESIGFRAGEYGSIKTFDGGLKWEWIGF
jgi:photosystem II stability/assembly factor-like uncharacterized protein